MVSGAEREALRRLGDEVRKISELPVMDEKRALWRALNDLRMQRPMVSIDQIPWHEMNDDGSLTAVVEDPFWRGIETGLRQTIYRWKRFPADMVVEGFVRIPMAIRDTGFGIGVSEKTAVYDERNSVLSHAYERQIDREEDIEKIRTPVVTHDEAETRRRLEEGASIFGDSIGVRASGAQTMLNVWDQVITRMGVEPTLLDMADRPEFIHAVLRRWFGAATEQLDQYEALGLLDPTLTTCHCTHTFNSTIPGEGERFGDPKQCWTAGMSQIFSTVGPEAHDEFELRYGAPYYARYGFVNYGCCEPLHTKIDLILERIPNTRKLSVSPWADANLSAERLGKRCVLCRKPNPAFVGGAGLDWKSAGAEIAETIAAAKRNGGSAEFVLKDISTLGYKPSLLSEWERRAMALVRG